VVIGIIGAALVNSKPMLLADLIDFQARERIHVHEIKS